MKQIFFMGTYESPNSVSAEWNSVHGGAQLGKPWQASQSGASILVAAGKIRKYRHIIWLPPGAPSTWTMEWIKAGTTQTNVEVTLTDAATDAEYTGADYSVAEGDRLTLRSTPNSGPAGTDQNQWSLEWEGTDSAEAFISNIFATKNVTTSEFTAITGAGGWVATDAEAAMLCPLNGTITKIYMAVASGVGLSRTYTCRLFKNGVASGAQIVLTSADGLLKGTTGLSVDCAPGDTFSWECTITGSGTTPIRAIQFLIIYEPDVEGESWICGRTSTLLPAAAGSQDIQWHGRNHSWNNSEFLVKELTNGAFILKDLYVELDAASSVDYTFTNRINGANGALTAAITAGNTNANDTTHDDALVAGDFLDLRVTASDADVTPPAARWACVQFIEPPLRRIFISNS